MFEKLKLLSNNEQVEFQLSSMQRKLINIKSEFGSIKIKYIEKVILICNALLMYCVAITTYTHKHMYREVTYLHIHKFPQHSYIS